MLNQYFESLVATYQADEHGRSLVGCLKDDWHLFVSPALEDEKAAELLSEILGRAISEEGRFSPAPKYESDRADRWSALREELLQRNRYFPTTEFDGKRLEQLLGYLIAREVPDTWYRARLVAGANQPTLGEMGAPPRSAALSGRANPPGIPYLYLASNRMTAISEVRPSVGEWVAVAAFQTKTALKLIDLRTPRHRISPFLLETEEEIGWMRGDIGLLERLGAELTRPVPRAEVGIEYVPSQYVCEFVKKCRYDGVIYASSVSDGMNLALFRPDDATAREPLERLEVTEVRIEVKRATGI